MKGDSSKVTIIEPGIVKAIDGKEYYNPQRIIAGHPDDIAAYKDKAGVDFTHCEKGDCVDCTEEQQKQCEEEVSSL